jgi:hypothetical protein
MKPLINHITSSQSSSSLKYIVIQNKPSEEESYEDDNTLECRNMSKTKLLNIDESTGMTSASLENIQRNLDIK